MMDDRAFFQIAAALLPALVFGGLISDRLKPPESRRDRFYGLALIVVTAGAVAILVAEVLAIKVATTGDPTPFERLFVSTAVIAATFLVLVLLVTPWAYKLPPSGRLAAIPLLTTAAALAVPPSISLIDAAVQESTLKAKQARLTQLGQDLNRASDESSAIGRALSRSIERFGATKPRPGEPSTLYNARLALREAEIESLVGDLNNVTERIKQNRKELLSGSVALR